jgi:glycosyltransferase involved in cell wall biosynthesis
MTHALIVLAVISLLELSLWTPPIWHHVRKPVACIVIMALSLTSGWLAGLHWSVWTVLLLIGSIYRVINLLRLIEGRSPVEYMESTFRRTSIILISSQIIVLLLVLLQRHTLRTLTAGIDGTGVIDLFIAAVLLVGTRSHIRKTRAMPLSEHRAQRDLPALSVAIPARNETDDLEACLSSLVASTYPKLEILVLDDCSQNKHTPGIIKDFAHAGVRFIAGKNPPKHWLAKNYAYEQLADAASGEILLFCGVDTRFEPQALEAMVGTMLARKKSMLSIVPHNMLPKGSSLESVIIQPARYAWELALPRRLLNRPPVLSTCWLIYAELLKDSGGFKAVMSSISIESYFARIAAKTRDGYSFLQSGQVLGLSSHKSIIEQRATTIRTRYPQTHRRPEIVAALSVLELFVLGLPYAFLIYALLMRSWAGAAIGITNVLVIMLFYIAIVRATYGTFILRSLWALPFAVVYDVGLLNYSMWRYEFREVIWKDRNVCIPLMRYGSQESAS